MKACRWSNGFAVLQDPFGVVGNLMMYLVRMIRVFVVKALIVSRMGSEWLNDLFKRDGNLTRVPQDVKIIPCPIAKARHASSKTILWYTTALMSRKRSGLYRTGRQTFIQVWKSHHVQHVNGDEPSYHGV
jgi:hypothetical protein